MGHVSDRPMIQDMRRLALLVIGGFMLAMSIGIADAQATSELHVYTQGLATLSVDIDMAVNGDILL